MRSIAALILVGLAGLTTVVRVARAEVTEDQAERIALDATRRASGEAHEVTDRDLSRRSWRFIVDSRWRVFIRPATGQVVTVYDHGFEKSPHQGHRFAERPAAAEIERVGRELLRKVYPDLDMSEMRLEYARPRIEAARVEARWRQLIPESGFPGPGLCYVDFCWVDRAIQAVGAETPPVPNQWRQTPAVPKEQAVEIAQASLGDLRGGWLEATRDLCVWDDANPPRPAWNVALRPGTRGDTASRHPERSVFVDPWTGEAFFTALWMSGGARAATAPQLHRPVQPLAAWEAERSTHAGWLVAAGALVLVVVLGAATVCLRRRRS